MRVLRVLIGGIIATTSVGAATDGAGQTAQIAEGKQKYAFYCASCHGTEGRGDGTLGKSLRKRPADLTQLAKKNQGQFPTDTVGKLIDGRSGDEAHLKGDMPIWGDVFSKSQTNTSPEDVKARIDALVKYLETIQDKG
jgi:mono/diheme cytochrome c family protein